MSGLIARFNALKHKIHSTKIPLSPRGQKIMLWVYCGTPVVVGVPFMWLVMWGEEKGRDRWQAPIRAGFTPPSPQMTIADLSQDLARVPSKGSQPIAKQ